MTIHYPPSALILLCGVSGSGKSTFARQHFATTEILSSDQCRTMLVDDASSQAVNDDAFALLHFWLELRLKHRRFTVVDSTALKPSAREPLLALAEKYHMPAYVLAFDIPLDEALRRDAARAERQSGEKVVTRHRATFEQALRALPREKRLAGLTVLTPETMDTAVIERRLPGGTGGQFDVIGDVHGCIDELRDLLAKLGYAADGSHPEGRTAAFVGDLADRGPDSPAVLALVCDWLAQGRAVFVPGNHDDKLFRLLRGAKVQRTHGLDLTEAQLDSLPESARERLVTQVLTLLASQPIYQVLDEGRLVIAHAGIRDDLIGSYSEMVARFTRFGDVRGFAENGMPLRHDWAAERVDGENGPLICYGHTPQDEITFVNNTVNLDGGCVFGGKLVALRYPERELVLVPAQRTYAARAFAGNPE